MKHRRKYRPLVLSLTSAALVMTMAGCGTNPQETDSAADDNTIVVVDGGGSYHDSQLKTTIEPFEKATGIKVVSVSYDYSVGAIKAQAKGAQSWDVVSIGNPISDADQAELFQKVDYGVVAEPGLPDEAKLPYQTLYVGYARVPAYRTDKFTTAPQTWADIWDTKKFPGTRQMENYPVGTLEVALMADGVDPKDLYPLDVKRALKKLDELTDSAKVVWWSAGAEMVQNFSTGVADIGVGWNGRLVQAKAEKIPVDYSLDGAIIQGTSWAVMKSSKKAENAMKFINFATSPKVAAADATDFRGNVPMNADAFEFMTPELAREVPSNPEHADTIAGWVDWNWWSNNFDDVYAEWQEWFGSR
jgi:putative spermidine/putrescine transport system substrate-binding protein